MLVKVRIGRTLQGFHENVPDNIPDIIVLKNSMNSFEEVYEILELLIR